MREEEEASIGRAAIGHILDLSMEGTTALTREPTVKEIETVCSIMVFADEIPMDISDGPSIVVGPSVEAERGAQAEAEQETRASQEGERRLPKKVGLTLEEFDELFIPNELRIVDLQPF